MKVQRTKNTMHLTSETDEDSDVLLRLFSGEEGYKENRARMKLYVLPKKELKE